MLSPVIISDMMMLPNAVLEAKGCPFYYDLLSHDPK